MAFARGIDLAIVNGGFGAAKPIQRSAKFLVAKHGQTFPERGEVWFLCVAAGWR